MIVSGKIILEAVSWTCQGGEELERENRLVGSKKKRKLKKKKNRPEMVMDQKKNNGRRNGRIRHIFLIYPMEGEFFHNIN